LDSLPGINGDEAWYGVQVERFLDGQVWSGRTPTGLPIGPLLFMTEAALLKVASQSFWVLRLPIALWTLVGLAATFLLHRWVFGNNTESLLVTVVLAAMPTHLAYSRFCWDSSFTLVATPFVLYPALKLGDKFSLSSLLLFTFGSALSIWSHVTTAAFVTACIVAVLAVHVTGDLIVRIRRWPVLALTIAILAVLTFSTAWLFVIGQSPRLRSHWKTLVTSVGRISDHLTSVADILCGPRVYEYIAGVSRPSWALPVYWLLLAIILFSGWQMIRSSDRRNRALLAIAACTVALATALGDTLWLERPSYERYFLYLLPLGAATLVRQAFIGWGTGDASLPTNSPEDGGLPIAPRALHARGHKWPFGLILAFSVVLLVQTWVYYFVPLRNQSHLSGVHPTFRTGKVEPKAAAALWIREQSEAQSRSLVFAEDWWLEQPIRYLLRTNGEVMKGALPADRSDRLYVVGFAGSNYLNQARETVSQQRRQLIEQEFMDNQGRPIVVVFVVD
jgi:hypothetical protein